MKAIAALTLLVLVAAALQLSGALWRDAARGVACTFCHD